MQSKNISLTGLFLSLVSLVTMMGCSMTSNNDETLLASELSSGTWYVEYIGERPVVDRSPASFRFDKNGKVFGNASCNQFRGEYKASGDHLTLSGLATTRRACVEVLDEQERRFLAVVPDVVEWKIDDGLLLLLGDSDQIIFQCAKQSEYEN